MLAEYLVHAPADDPVVRPRPGRPKRPVHDLPCRRHDPELWFAEAPAELERAKALCTLCPIRTACLSEALAQREPWGVWGGEIVVHGAVIAHKRPRGRPRKTPDGAAA